MYIPEQYNEYVSLQARIAAFEELKWKHWSHSSLNFSDIEKMLADAKDDFAAMPPYHDVHNNLVVGVIDAEEKAIAHMKKCRRLIMSPLELLLESKWWNISLFSIYFFFSIPWLTKLFIWLNDWYRSIFSY